MTLLVFNINGSQDSAAIGGNRVFSYPVTIELNEVPKPRTRIRLKYVGFTCDNLSDKQASISLQHPDIASLQLQEVLIDNTIDATRKNHTLGIPFFVNCGTDGRFTDVAGSGQIGSHEVDLELGHMNTTKRTFTVLISGSYGHIVGSADSRGSFSVATLMYEIDD